jgi:Flp pilus assembly pilin Flp
MFQQFLRDEKGQTTVEYLLIIAVIVVVISVLGREMKNRLPDTVAQVFKGVNQKIQQLMSAGVN